MRKNWSCWFRGILLACLAWVGPGAGSVAAAAGPAAAAEEDIFKSEGPPRLLRLEIAERDMAVLRRYRYRFPGNGQDRPSVSAIVREGDRVYTNVAVHLKGAAGSFRPVDGKPALTLKFNANVPGQLFHGLAKISLNNSVQDSTFLTEKICRELFARVGVPVPRSDFATVEMNGRPLGLYVLVEGWDKRFLRRHFGIVDGNLYDPPQLYDIDRPLRVASGKHREDRSALKRAVAAAAEPDLAKRVEALRGTVDIDRLLSHMAMDVLLWNWDGYALFQNNYRVFHDLDHDRIVFMPHGLDQMFWKPDGPIVTGRNGLVARAWLQTPEGRKLFLERLRRLRAEVFDSEALTNRVRELAARVAPAAAREGILAGFFHARAVGVLCQRIVQRARSVDEQLAALGNWRGLAVGESLTPDGWRASTITGAPQLKRDPATGALSILASKGSAAAWCSTVWLEEGAYTLTARIKTTEVTPSSRQPLKGAGVRVVSRRKQSAGLRWSWFPFHESRDFTRRGEVTSPTHPPARYQGTTDWTEMSCEIDLREPLADLEILCELYADQGEAWFDPASVKLTRKTEVGAWDGSGLKLR